MMNNAQLATASLNDIVFDGRNQRYGAYQLRHLYQRHVTRALIIATAIFALLLAFPLISQLLKKDTPVAPPKKVTENILIAPPLDQKVVTPPVVAPPVAPPAAQRIPQATTRFTQLVAAPDNQVTEEVPEQEALQTAHVGPVTTIGEASNADVTELATVEGPTAVTDVVDTKTYVSVEQMPQLPGGGGTTAIVAAIQRAARYPSLALSNGVEGRVFVSFTVNAKGDVVDAKIIKGLGSGLDEETLRAIASLPRFIPGKQNGREVSVSFTVPVTYNIQ